MKEKLKNQLQRTNKAEKQDFHAIDLLDGAVAQLGARMGRMVHEMEVRTLPAPPD